MITYALGAFFRCERIDALYVVSDPEWMESIRDDVISAYPGGFEAMGKDNVHGEMISAHHVGASAIAGFASPGENRQYSILNGMKSILDDVCRGGGPDGFSADDTVIIHDAARPFITEELINSCYDALPGHDGVMPVLPMKDTVYRSEDGKSVSELLDRSRIFAGQAPELFRFKPYYKANLDLLPDRIKLINGASEPGILAGMDIVMIPGDERNSKVTTAGDLKRFIRTPYAGESEDANRTPYAGGEAGGTCFE